jgi:hypothetical protein
MAKDNKGIEAAVDVKDENLDLSDDDEKLTINESRLNVRRRTEEIKEQRELDRMMNDFYDLD